MTHVFPLPWSGYVRLLSVRVPSARNFYETEALRCGWSVRQLDRQINSQFYERIALSRNKGAMLQKAEVAEPQDTITPEQALKDPFVLEFLNLKDEYSESDLEDALIRHLADFLLELGGWRLSWTRRAGSWRHVVRAGEVLQGTVFALSNQWRTARSHSLTTQLPSGCFTLNRRPNASPWQ